MKDDNVPFQWGDTYIIADQVIDGVGGKYWRDNNDGTITEYYPAVINNKSCVFEIGSCFNHNFKYDKKGNYTWIKYKTKKIAKEAYEFAMKDSFIQDKKITITLKGKKLFFDSSTCVSRERTIVPAENNYRE